MATITLQHPSKLSQGFAQRITGRVTGNGYTVNANGLVTVDTQDSPIMLANGWLPTIGGGAGAIATSGVAVLDFGAFPGQPMASVVVSSVDFADPNAELDAWIIPVATVDHTADEHIADGPAIIAAYTTPGTSFTITGSQNAKTLPVPPGTPFGGAASQMPVGQQQLNPYGKWSVAWAFSP